MKKFVLFSAVLSLLLFAVPSATNASATPVGDRHVLFSIDFDFVAANEPYRIPVLALPSSAESDKTALRYSLSSDSEAGLPGSNFAGIVLADLEVEDGMYVVPENSRADFTFFGILTLSETVDAQTVELSVSEFPHFRGDELRFVSDTTLARLVSGTVEIGTQQVLLK